MQALALKLPGGWPVTGGMSNHDEWKATWDWAKKVWGEDPEGDYSFNWFFGQVAQKVAEAEEWEELGSSDVWCATKWMVDDAKRDGVTTREDLMEAVMDCSGYFYGMERKIMLAKFGESSPAVSGN